MSCDYNDVAMNMFHCVRVTYSLCVYNQAKYEFTDLLKTVYDVIDCINASVIPKGGALEAFGGPLGHTWNDIWKSRSVKLKLKVD